jgi:peptidoglycan hydrolase-like protein with peptidoglycan-binding domain
VESAQQFVAPQHTNTTPRTTFRTTTSTAATTPTTTAAAGGPAAGGAAGAQPTQTLGAVPPSGLGPGATGEQVAALEQRLVSLHFDVGRLDGSFDGDTAHAVVAFQKVAGLPRTGRVTQEVADALATAQPPSALVPGGGATRVEVDLPRQVLFVYQADALVKILPVSSGTGKRYCAEGECGIADTPAGAYRVEGRIPGWRKSRLGRLWNPVYFDQRKGLAIHGYLSVPPEPASHGCVRIPMFAAGWFFQQVPDGTPVYVLDGKTPVP